MLNLTNLTPSLSANNLSCEQRREDQIPYLTVWKNEGLLSLKEALQICYLVLDEFSCPVHFHQMDESSISFFVFPVNEEFSDDAVENYGTPLAQWIPAVSNGLHPLIFKLKGKIVAHNESPADTYALDSYLVKFPLFEHFHPSVKSGSWRIYRKASEISELWKTICDWTSQGSFSAARVSTHGPGNRNPGMHHIDVFTADWSDQADVESARKLLRRLGVTEVIKYHRNIDELRNLGSLDSLPPQALQAYFES